MPQGLPRKLRRVFVLQALLAIIAVVASLYVSSVFARGVLATHWVQAEAARFWGEVAEDPAYAPPWSSSVNGYFVPAGTDPVDAGVPAEYIAAGPGLHRLKTPGSSQRLLVEDGPGGRLYLQIAFRLVDNVGRWSILIAALLTSLAIATVSWLSYRIARRMVLPVTAMAAEVANWDPLRIELEAIDPAQLPGEVGSEVRMLEGALRGLAERTQAFVRRERDFTREASHELRTPLTVVRVAVDMLRRDPELPQRMHRSLDRVQVAARDMEAVLDALLILAREDVASNTEVFEALEVASEAVAAGRALLGEPDGDAAVGVSLVGNSAPRLRGSRRAMAVILEQLVRNACTFTPTGSIEVCVEHDRIEVRDTGVGMARDVLERVFEPFYRADQYVGGRGLGLAIVRRLAGRYGWSVHIESAPGQGTNVILRFPVAADD
ncbi:HAMP domain-containing sensor histidine kinase [Luteimonas sp. MJ246]|uniref:sensor histidine kinase n=1 Tax=Luteimonas sp. MJ174 TaxID=3129237 RepID=UPI0031B9BDF5